VYEKKALRNSARGNYVPETDIPAAVLSASGSMGMISASSPALRQGGRSTPYRLFAGFSAAKVMWGI